jgi:hypothetical protein
MGELGSGVGCGTSQSELGSDGVRTAMPACLPWLGSTCTAGLLFH